METTSIPKYSMQDIGDHAHVCENCGDALNPIDFPDMHVLRMHEDCIKHQSRSNRLHYPLSLRSVYSNFGKQILAGAAMRLYPKRNNPPPADPINVPFIRHRITFDRKPVDFSQARRNSDESVLARGPKAWYSRPGPMRLLLVTW